MGVFALKGYIGVIAAHIAAAGWNDLLDHYQNVFVPICHLDPKIRLKKIGPRFKNIWITSYVNAGVREKCYHIWSFIDNKGDSLVPLSGLDDLVIHLFQVDPKTEAFSYIIILNWKLPKVSIKCGMRLTGVTLNYRANTTQHILDHSH